MPPDTAAVMRRSYGLRAAVARAGGFNKSYVTRVLSGAKPPGIRFLKAVAVAAEHFSRRAELELVRAEVDRINDLFREGAIARGPREKGAR